MSMTDPISDMLTRIRNAQTARKPSVTLPSSKQKLAVAKVLEQEGYLASVSTENVEGKDVMTLELKYYQDKPVIERIERVSRPGLRIFKRVDQLPVVQGGSDDFRQPLDLRLRRARRTRRRDRVDVGGRHDERSSQGEGPRRRSPLHRSLTHEFESLRCRE